MCQKTPEKSNVSFFGCPTEQRLKIKFISENKVILSCTLEFAELDLPLPQYSSPPPRQTLCQTGDPRDMLHRTDVNSPLAFTTTTFLTVIIARWGFLSSVFCNTFRRQTLGIYVQFCCFVLHYVEHL